MTKRLHILPMLAAALMFYVITPAAHHAQLFADDATTTQPQGTPANGNLQTSDGNGGKTTCSNAPGGGGVLLGVIIPCITNTIATTTQSFSAQMIDMLMPAFYAFLAFVVTMFGVKVMQGGQPDIHKEGFLLLLKIGLVIGILQMIPNTIVPSVYGIMASSQEVVAGALGPNGANFHCNVAQYQSGNTPLVWAEMDCVMGKLYGFTTGANGSHNMFLASSMIGLLGGFFFGGTFGIALFLACVGVLLSVFMLVIRTANAFLNGYLTICVMLLIAPLFMPLVLLRVTNNYFEPWWKNILAGFLTPLLVSAYAMFALLLYDDMLFAPDAMINQIFNYANVSGAEQLPTSLCSKRITGNPASAARFGGTTPSSAQQDQVYSAPSMQTIAAPAADDICALAKKQVFNFPDGSSQFKDAKATFLKMFNDCMKLIVLGYVIHAGVEQVMSAIRQLTGTATAAALMGATGKVEQRFQQGLSDAKTGAIQAIGNKSGGAFISGLPGAMTDATKGFFTGMSR